MGSEHKTVRRKKCAQVGDCPLRGGAARSKVEGPRHTLRRDRPPLQLGSPRENEIREHENRAPEERIDFPATVLDRALHGNTRIHGDRQGDPHASSGGLLNVVQLTANVIISLLTQGDDLSQIFKIERF